MFALNISNHYEYNCRSFYDMNANNIFKAHKVPEEIQIYNLNCFK